MGFDQLQHPCLGAAPPRPAGPMWRGAYRHACVSEMQPGTLTCIHMRKLQLAHENPHMEKAAPALGAPFCCEWRMGLELMADGAAA